MVACGSNKYGRLILRGDKQDVFPPEETTITGNVTFLLLGSGTSITFVGVEPPANTPNRKITIFAKPVQPTKIIATPTKVPTPKKTSRCSTPSKSSAPKETESKELISKVTVFKESVPKELESLSEVERLKRMLELKEKEHQNAREKSEMLEKENEELRAESRSKRRPLQLLNQETLEKMKGKKTKLLGTGATSEVFEVTREEKLALKVYKREFLRDNENANENDDDDDNVVNIGIDKMRRFLQEYEVLNQMYHPNVIKAFGFSFGDEENPPAILLEYCPTNLKKKIKRLTNEERINAIVDISSAMKLVHSVSIIHRDLKVESILLDEQKKIKVSDF